jgi:hypothetical protein
MGRGGNLPVGVGRVAVIWLSNPEYNGELASMFAGFDGYLVRYPPTMRAFGKPSTHLARSIAVGRLQGVDSTQLITSPQLSRMSDIMASWLPISCFAWRSNIFA